MRQAANLTADESQLSQKPETLKIQVKPVANAIEILRLLATRQPRTATEMSRILQINISTCFNILRTMASQSIVSFDSLTKTYEIGPGMLQLVSLIMSEDRRTALAKPILKRFVQRHHGTVCLWRRGSPSRNVLIATEHEEGTIRIELPIGQIYPVLLGSNGRVMALRLGLTKKQVEADFNRLRWHNPPTFEDFWADAEIALERGWALDNGAFSAGVAAISAPIVAANGQIGFTLTSIFFQGRYKDEELPAIGEALVAAAQELSSFMTP